MPGPVALSHDQAGRVEPVRLAVRSAEPNAPVEERSLEAAFDADARRVGGLEVRLELARAGDALCVTACLANVSPQPLALDALVLGFCWQPPRVEALRFLRHGSGSDDYTGVRPVDAHPEPPPRPAPQAVHPIERPGWHASALVSVVGEASGGPSCLAGVYERGRSFTTLYLRREGRAVHIEVEQRVEAVLEPGQVRELETLHLSLGCDAAALLERFAEAYGRSAGARVFRPFLASFRASGSGGEALSEDMLRRQLENLVALRGEIPIDVVEIHEGWQRAVGDWLEPQPGLPRGLAALVAEIRQADFIPGLWTAPFCVSPQSQLFGKHGDWLLRDPDDPSRALRAPAWPAEANAHVLDTSRADVIEHIEHLYRELVDMGFVALTLDRLGAVVSHARSARPDIGPAERLRRGVEAVRAGAGEEAFLRGAGCPLGALVGVVDAVDVAADVGPRTRFDAVAPAQRAEAVRAALRNVATRAWMHRRLWLNDGGSLPADAQLPRARVEGLACALAGTGSLLNLAVDPSHQSRAQRALVRATLEGARAVDGIGIPSGLRVVDPLAAEIPRRVVAMRKQGEILALLNDRDAPLECPLDLPEAGRSLGPVCAVDTRIGHAPPLADRSGVRVLDPHGGALLRVRRGFPVAVFCDFDGTFSIQDVGSTLAQRHAGPKRSRAWARYERGELTAWQYNMQILDGLELPVAALETFLRTVQLDPGARHLLDWCEQRGVPFRILSDGFDWNLNRLQVLHGVRFAHSANHLHYERGRWRIRPGLPDASCACGTGACKGSFLRNFRAVHPGARLVHIGNGRVSDTCGALAADLVFAKDALATELAGRGVAFERFETLHDVIPVLERVLDERPPARAS